MFLGLVERVKFDNDINQKLSPEKYGGARIEATAKSDERGGSLEVAWEQMIS